MAIDRAHEADLLVSGAVGLGLDVVHERRSLAGVRKVLEYHLARIFPAEAAGPLETAEAAGPGHGHGHRSSPPGQRQGTGP